MTAALRVGTRGSALATTQTRMVAEALAAALGDVTIEIVPITTHGDVSRASLSSLGGTGVFATALRDALHAGECDVVVHSFKDLPTAPAPGLAIGAVPVREDARDVIVTRDGTRLEELPAGARIGTGSPRRIAQVRGLRPDLDVVDIRGNVDSRLARLDAAGAERLDAVVLSLAGLARLGRAGELPLQAMPLEEWPTAPAQGALAVEVRAADAPGAADGSGPFGTRLSAALAHIDDAVTAAAAAAERGVLAGLQAGCSAPLGASARYADGRFALSAAAYSLDGTRRVTASVALGAAPADLDATAADAARAVVARMLDDGAAELVPPTAAQERNA